MNNLDYLEIFENEYHDNINAILEDYLFAVNDKKTRYEISIRLSQLTQMYFKDVTEQDDEIQGRMEFWGDLENGEKIKLQVG